MSAEDNPLLNSHALNMLRGVRQQAFHYRCTIQRGESPGTDDYGHPMPIPEDAWANHLVDVPCAFLPKGGGQQGERTGADTNYTAGLPELHVPPGTDVRVSDRISEIKNRAGDVVEATVPYYNIVQVVPRETYTLLLLEAIS
jgi:hypothetical protein